MVVLNVEAPGCCSEIEANASTQTGYAYGERHAVTEEFARQQATSDGPAARYPYKRQWVLHETQCQHLEPKQTAVRHVS